MSEVDRGQRRVDQAAQSQRIIRGRRSDRERLGNGRFGGFIAVRKPAG